MSSTKSDPQWKGVGFQGSLIYIVLPPIVLRIGVVRILWQDVVSVVTPTEGNRSDPSIGGPPQNRSIPERRGGNPILQDYQISGEILSAKNPFREIRTPRRIIDRKSPLREPEISPFVPRSRRPWAEMFLATPGTNSGVGGWRNSPFFRAFPNSDFAAAHEAPE